MVSALQKLSLIVLITMSACTKEVLKPVPTPEFKVTESLTADRTTVSFASGEQVTFKAKFNIVTDWKLVIEGKRSKKTKTFTGKSDVIDASNALWDGSSDVPVFTADDVIYTLSYPYELSRGTVSGNLVVTSGKNYSANANYVLVKDFANGSKDILFNNENCSVSSIDSVLGGYYYNVEGTETSTSSFYMGHLAILPSAEHPSAMYFPIIPSGMVANDLTAENTWFNIWVYGYGNSSAILTFKFDESDIENTPNVHTPNKDDSWEYTTDANWSGWRQVSFPMSLTTSAPNPLFGGNGNKKREIDRMVSLNIVVASKNSVTDVLIKAPFQYAVFSVGGAFK